MLQISRYGRDLLFRQAENKKLQTGEYLQDVENENFEYIRDKFFSNEKLEKALLLNVGSGIFTTIADVFAFYVGNTDYDFWISMDEFVRDMISVWFCTIGLERVDWKLQMIYQPAKNYRQENWIDKISRLYIDDNEYFYVLVQTYMPWYIENKLYKLVWTSLTSWEEVKLDTIPQTAGLQERVETWLNVPALIVIRDNLIPMVEKVKPLVYAVDRQVVMNHTQYLQNGESFVIFKGIKRPQKTLDDYHKWVKIDYSKLGRVINGDVDSSIEFVNNTNALIQTAISDMDNFIRRISSITTIPVEFLWLESKEWAIGVGSRTLRHGAFMKKVQYYRDLLDEALLDFLELIKAKNDTYHWEDIFAKSSSDLADELKVAREALIISQYNAVKQYGNYTDEETQEEMDRIDEENKSKAPVVPTLDPTKVDPTKDQNYVDPNLPINTDWWTQQ